MTLADRCEKKLYEYFGHEKLFDFQREVIDLMEGADVLATAPTGKGKSMVFQLPPLVTGQTVVVVSPLISLMKDQVDGLKKKGIAAEHTASVLSSDELVSIFRKFRQGKLRLLYTSPERFVTKAFQRVFKRAYTSGRIMFLAIDEAHTISFWAKDFRPSFKTLRNHIPEDLKLVMLTATAPQDVIYDVVDMFPDREFEVFTSNPVRDNINLRCVDRYDEGHVASLARTFVRRNKSGLFLLYARSRKLCEELAAALSSYGFPARPYHAGLDKSIRAENQDMFSTGDIRFLCATNAFGMGIDLPNIRIVYHHTLPSDLAAYVQESGRAGRDGHPATAILNYSPKGESTQNFFIRESNPKFDTYLRLWREAIKPIHSKLTAKHSTGYLAMLGKCGHSQAEAAVFYMEYCGLIEILKTYNKLSGIPNDPRVERSLRRNGHRVTEYRGRIYVETYMGDENPLTYYASQNRVRDLNYSKVFEIARRSSIFSFTRRMVDQKETKQKNDLKRLVNYCKVPRNHDERLKYITDYFEVDL